MGKFIRFYNQNRKGIWLFLTVVFFLFIILQLVNHIVGKQNNEKIYMKQSNSSEKIEDSTNNKAIIKDEKSTVSGKKISSETLDNYRNAIEKFFEYCNEEKINEAYNMLTVECKEEMYPNVDNFYNLYCSKIPRGKGISYEIENWINNTYKVKIIEDMLSTGKVKEEGDKQDYITIKKEGDTYLLNINNYIGRTTLNSENEVKDVKLTVIQKDVYIDFEKYKINVENKTSKDILLDTQQELDTMYIIDSNGVKYTSYINELTKADLTVNKGHNKTVSIKYHSSYNSNKNIKEFVLSKVIMDYDIKTQDIIGKSKALIRINI